MSSRDGELAGALELKSWSTTHLSLAFPPLTHPPAEKEGATFSFLPLSHGTSDSSPKGWHSLVRSSLLLPFPPPPPILLWDIGPHSNRGSSGGHLPQELQQLRDTQLPGGLAESG